MLAAACWHSKANEVTKNDTTIVESPVQFGLGAYWGVGSSFPEEFRGGIELTASSVSRETSPYFVRVSLLASADHRNFLSAGASYSVFWEPLRVSSESWTLTGHLGAGVYLGSRSSCWFNNVEESSVNYGDHFDNSCELDEVAFAAYPEAGIRLSYGPVNLTPFVRYYIGDSKLLTAGANISFTF